MLCFFFLNKTKDAVVSVAVFSSTLLPPTVNSENYKRTNKVPSTLLLCTWEHFILNLRRVLRFSTTVTDEKSWRSYCDVMERLPLLILPFKDHLKTSDGKPHWLFIPIYHLFLQKHCSLSACFVCFLIVRYLRRCFLI